MIYTGQGRCGHWPWPGQSHLSRSLLQQSLNEVSTRALPPLPPHAVTRRARRDSHNLLQTTWPLFFKGQDFFNFQLRMNVTRHWSFWRRITNALKICSHHLKSVHKIIFMNIPIFYLCWTDTVTNRHGQLTWGDRGRGYGGGGVAPLLGETTDCLYRSHKFPKDNIVTLSTFTIFLNNPTQGFLTYFLDQVLWFQDKAFFYEKCTFFHDV